MISIVVCSRSGTLNDELAKNIRTTIGCDYELTIIDNSRNSYSIYEAYNKGLEKAKGEIVCFVHDDILFHTKNWGIILYNLFGYQQNIGLIGIAGGVGKSKMPSPWWNSFSDHIRIIQNYENRPSEEWNKGFSKSKEVEVSAIDGVFMAMKADDRIKFDTRLKGFHNYDLLLSILTRSLGKRVIVTNRILIEHFSAGKLNKDWFKSTSKIHRLYSQYLPLDENFQNGGFFRLERRNFTFFIKKSYSLGLYRITFYWILRFFYQFKFSLAIHFFEKLRRC